MMKHDYYWTTMHKGKEQKEVQDADYFTFWKQVNRLLLDGWTVDCMKIMNRSGVWEQ